MLLTMFYLGSFYRNTGNGILSFQESFCIKIYFVFPQSRLNTGYKTGSTLISHHNMLDFLRKHKIDQCCINEMTPSNCYHMGNRKIDKNCQCQLIT